MAGDLAPRVLAALGAMAAGVSEAALAYGILFVATPAGGSVVDGVAPGDPTLTYHWDRAAGELVLSQTIAGIAVPFSEARPRPGGIYYDAQNTPIARVVAGRLVIDFAAATQTLSVAHDDGNAKPQTKPLSQTGEEGQPKLCPDHAKDVPHGASDNSKAYQQSVTGLTPGLAVFLNGFHFDGCRSSTGVMIEVKANYAQFLDKNGDWAEWYKRGVDDLRAQMMRASAAAGARGVEYHVKEKAVADRFRAMVKELKLPNVVVVWNPRGDHAG